MGNDPVERLLGNVERHVSPSPEFAARLLDRLLVDLERKPGIGGRAEAEADGNAEVPTSVMDHRPLPSSPGAAMPWRRLDADRPRRARARARAWWPYVEAAAVIALLLGLVGGFFGGHRALPKLVAPWREPAPAGVAMFRGGPARTGEMVGPGPVAPPRVVWDFDASAESDTVSSSPAVVDGVVYVGTGNRDAKRGALRAFDAATGRERWVFRTDDHVASSPAVADATVYIGSLDGNLYAVDATTGAPRWNAALGEPVYESSPVVVDGVVYVESGGAASSPAVVDGVVYVGGGTRIDQGEHPGVATLHALDAATGAERWRYDARGGGLHVVAAASGRRLWLYQTAGVQTTAPAVADGVVYVTSFNLDTGAGLLDAVDVATHKLRWRFRTGGLIDGSPAVAEGIVYVGSDDGRLYAVDAATGRQRWAFAAGDRIASSPAVADGVVYVGSDDGYLYAVDAATGAERWRFAAAAPIASSPAVTNGALYIGSGRCEGGGCGNGRFYALGASSAGASRRAE